MATSTAIALGFAMALCTAGAVAAVAYTMWTISRWPKVTAQVVRYRITQSEGDHGQSLFHPVYRFQTVEGGTITSMSSWGSWHCPWKRETTISIRYCLENPRRTRVQCFTTNWGGAATLAGSAIMFWFVLCWLPRWWGMSAAW